MRHFFSLRYLPLVFVLLCTACGTALPTVKPYKLDVQQGNVVTSKMLLQLRPGMTKSQVRFIMGTPLIQDSFHGNRWDYVYQLREKGKIVEQRRVILDFENELLKSVRGDVIPAGTGPKESESASTGTRTVKPVEKAKDKSLMDKLKFWKKDEVPPVVVPPADGAKPDQTVPKSETAPLAEPPVESTPPASQPDAGPADSPASPEQNAPAAEESRSILSVPMEVPTAPTDGAPSDSAPSETAPVEAAPESSAAPAATTPELAPETAPADSAPNAAPPASVNEPSAPPAPYEPASGMQFDRNLNLDSQARPVEQAQPVERAPVENKPAPAPRAGNKDVPAPKDLPAEGEPDFFEKMLEKIGF